MKLEPSPAFNRDLRRIRDRELQLRIARKLEDLEAASSIIEVSNVRQMAGWAQYYRISIGDYRLGLEMDGDVAFLLRFMHRRDIYRHFP